MTLAFLADARARLEKQLTPEQQDVIREAFRTEPSSKPQTPPAARQR